MLGTPPYYRPLIDISQAGDYIKKSTLSLYNRICSQDSPTRDLCVYFTQMYISSGIRVPGSLVDRVIGFCASPLSVYILITILSHQPMKVKIM